MAVYFAIFQILPTFVYELFETMQSSVTRSRTSITKSLPASFKLSIFNLSSESYIKILGFFKKFWFDKKLWFSRYDKKTEKIDSWEQTPFKAVHWYILDAPGITNDIDGS